MEPAAHPVLSDTAGKGQGCLRSDDGRAAAEAATPKTVMIDATYLKAHRTATSLRSKKGDLATKGAV